MIASRRRDQLQQKSLPNTGGRGIPQSIAGKSVSAMGRKNVTV